MPLDPPPDAHPQQTELAALADIGRAILEAQLDEDQLCELIYKLAGQVVPTDNFQLGLIDADRYQMKVWIRDGKRQLASVFVIPPGRGVIDWMRETRRPLLVHDFEAEMESLPFRPTYQSEHPPRSAIFLPLLAGEAVVGSIAIQSRDANAFSDDDLRVLSVLANQAASALNNARLYRRGQRRLNDLTGVAEVSRRITRILDLDRLLDEVVALIKERFGYYHVQIFLVPQGSDRAYFKASSGHGVNEKWRREGRSLRIGREGIIGWVAQRGKALLVNDVALEPRYIPDDPRLLPDTRAELAAPLLVEDKVVGVLDVQSTQVGAFGEDDLFVLRTLANQVAVAVNSARAYEAQREEAWVTTVMLQVAETMSQADGIEEVFTAAVRVTAMLGGVDSCAIWLWDDDAGAFRYAAGFGLRAGEGARESLTFLSGGWPALDRLREAKTPAIVGLGDPLLPGSLAAALRGDTGVLLPMSNKGQVFGVLCVSWASESAPGLNRRRLSMLAGIAHEVAATIDNTRLSAAWEEEARVSTVLLQVAEAIGRFQPLDTTLATVAQIAPLLAGVDRCAVLLREPDGSFVVRQVHASPPSLTAAYDGAVIHAGELPLLDDASRLGQPLVVADAERSPRVPPSWRARYASRTLLVVPILVADDVIGALLADDVESTHQFSPRRVRILSGIASQAAVAIENARLHAQETANVRLLHELELGHAIQRQLLPQAAPHIPGYQVVYRWRSAQEVGGDFFDFIPLPSGELGIVIADVSDKGIPAALYMMFARTLLRSIAFSGRPPAAMLARTNELIVADSSADMFVTAYYSMLDIQEHTLTYASAGHNLALYVPAQGAPRAITTGGLPMGILAPVTFEQKSIALQPGELVLFYTDGVTEARNAEGEFFGDTRLEALLAAHQAEQAEAIADAIDKALDVFVGSSAQYDDVTLVLVKRDP